ncbi:hypothetical protein EOM09_05740 [bacterium]|nr:hypothetical protein [bacterium]
MLTYDIYNQKNKIIIASRYDVEIYEWQKLKNLICISVRSGDDNELPNITGINDILFLKFDDIDLLRYPEVDFNNEAILDRSYQLFNVEMAQQILEYTFDKYDFANSNLSLLVHCDAGISRSAGIGAAIAKISFDDDFLFFKRLAPNRFVYKTILEQYYGNIMEDKDIPLYKYERGLKKD